MNSKLLNWNRGKKIQIINIGTLGWFGKLKFCKLKIVLRGKVVNEYPHRYSYLETINKPISLAS